MKKKYSLVIGLKLYIFTIFQTPFTHMYDVTDYVNLNFSGWKLLHRYWTTRTSTLNLFSGWQPFRAFLANRNRMPSRFYWWYWCLLVNASTGLRYYFTLEWPSISRIKNFIKPNRVQHILRHIYYATMQKLCKFEALYRPEIQCKSHKGNP